MALTFSMSHAMGTYLVCFFHLLIGRSDLKPPSPFQQVHAIRFVPQ